MRYVNCRIDRFGTVRVRDKSYEQQLLYYFNYRTLALLRWDLYFMRMRLQNRIADTSAKIKKHVEAIPDPRYLKLGSGPRGLVDPHWLNIDGFVDTNVHYPLILTPLAHP